MKKTQKKIAKTTLLMASFIVLVTGCSLAGNKAQDDMEQLLSKKVENARINVSWPGTYQGMLPCDGACDGLATMIVLYPDDHFTLRTRKMGIDIKDKIDEGRIIWQENGSDLILSGDSALTNLINHIRVNRDSLSLYQQQVIPDTESTVIELDKTGGIPIPPPAI